MLIIAMQVSRQMPRARAWLVGLLKIGPSVFQ